MLRFFLFYCAKQKHRWENRGHQERVQKGTVKLHDNISKAEAENPDHVNWRPYASVMV